MNLSIYLRPVSALAAAAIAAIILAGPAAPEARGSGGPPGSSSTNSTSTNSTSTNTTTTKPKTIALTNLYSFTSAAIPAAALVQGPDGNLYGTTTGSGTGVYGSVFQITPQGKFTNLVLFNGTNLGPNTGNIGSTNGAPSGPLVLAPGGFFYGTASASVTNGLTNNYGTNNYGTIFSVTTGGLVTNLATFGSAASGWNPVGGLTAGPNGNYYGVTSYGGAYGYGTVFEWSPAGGLVSLGSFTYTNGAYPQAGLVSNWDGNLYGTTSQGGSNGVGTVFQLIPSSGAVNMLASFSNYNGAYPGALLPINNNLVGTTSDGGNYNLGAVFSVTLSGIISLVASFDLANGSTPNSPLLLAADGLLYGTTLQGGANGLGVVFQMTTNGTGGTNGVVWTNGTTYGASGGLFTNPPSTLTDVFSFDGSGGAYPGAFPMAGLIQGTDFKVYGTTTAGASKDDGNVFALTFPPGITKEPTNVNLSLGSTAQFTVQASASAGGSNGLSYQWQWAATNNSDYTDVPNNQTFSGATNATLTISNEALLDAGSYQVVVSNTAGLQISSVVTLTIPAPTIAITPKPSPNTNNATLKVMGTANVPGGVAGDQVTEVLYEINGGTWTPANPVNYGDWLTWSAPVTLTAGSNIFKAYSLDPLGNQSQTASATVFYVTDSTLTLLTNGFGGNKPGFTNKADRALTTNGLVYTNLVVGLNYTVTASPGSDALFADWIEMWTTNSGTNSATVSNTATGNPLTFNMQSNMTLTANFVPNPFLAAKGDYSGLFSTTNTTSTTNTITTNTTTTTNVAVFAGLLQNLVVRTNGAYSGKLYFGATNYTVSGTFDAYGAATNQITKSLTLGMNLITSTNTNIPPQVTGWVQQTGNEEFTATNLLAELAATNVVSPQYTNTALYTNARYYTTNKSQSAILIPPATNAPGSTIALGSTNAPGYGYALVTNHLGTASVTGRLADGSAFNETVPISQDGGLPIFAALPNNSILWGRLGITNQVPGGNLTWLRQAGPQDVITNSFTNFVTVLSELWTPPTNKTLALQCPAGQLMISNYTISNYTISNYTISNYTISNYTISNYNISNYNIYTYTITNYTISNYTTNVPFYYTTNLVFYVAVSNDNVLAKLGSQPANSLTGSINPKTGLLTVTFGKGNGEPSATGYGIVEQGSDAVLGFFTNASGAGLLTLNTNLSTNGPMIYENPASQKYEPQGTNHFIVGAIGAPTLSYQWIFVGIYGTNMFTGGTNGTGEGTFTGLGTSNLTIVNEGILDAGSYFVIVSNAYGSVTSAKATLTVPAPTLAITAPVSSTTNPMLTVKGTASDEYGLSAVQWQYGVNAQILSNGWDTTPTNEWTNKLINWTDQWALQPGTNFFHAYSVDHIGNHSLTNTVTTFYVTYGTLALLTNGSGTIKPDFSNKHATYPPNGVIYSNLVVGKNYTVTASPGSNTLFTNWIETWTTNSATVTSTATSNPLTFNMQSNMTLTANFTSNFFIPNAGIYNGLFYTNANSVTWDTAGMLYNLSVKTNGAYSGKLFIAGTNYPLTGSFDLSGQASNSFGTNTNSGPLVVEMTLATNQIGGTVSNNLWSANLTAELAATSLPPNEYTTNSNEYTMLLSNTNTNTPPGDGYALVTNYNGMFTFSGALADGTSFHQTVPLSQSGDLPIYDSLYGNTGLLLGWVNLTNVDLLRASNGLTWLSDTGGFTNTLSVQSSPWNSPGPKSNALPLTNHLFLLSGPVVGSNLDFDVMLTTTNTFTTNTATNSFYGSIAYKTGLLSITYINSNGIGAKGVGAVLQNSNMGGGFFTNISGSFSMTTNQ
jgi:uncharacterized repeat protein (TIGR03803 family)